MVKKLDLGFISPERGEEFPYRTAFRCKDETMKQLLDIKAYCSKYLEKEPASASELIRQAIKFGHVFCLMQESSINERKLKRNRQ